MVGEWVGTNVAEDWPDHTRLVSYSHLRFLLTECCYTTTLQHGITPTLVCVRWLKLPISQSVWGKIVCLWTQRSSDELFCNSITHRVTWWKSWWLWRSTMHVNQKYLMCLTTADLITSYHELNFIKVSKLTSQFQANFCLSYSLLQS